MASCAQSESKILIVGAGPAGLIAALTLIRNNVPVRIIEKSTTARIGQRGAGVMPRTWEVFEALGFLNEALEYSYSIPLRRVYKPGSGTEVAKEYPMHTIADPTPDRPYNPRHLGQENLDKILRGIFEKLGHHIEMGLELVDFKQDADQVHVTLKNSAGELEESSYDYVIGADGARGVVRKKLGLAFHGETTEQKMAVGEFFAEGLQENVWHEWGDVRSYLLNIRPTERPGLFTFVTGGRLLPNPEEIVQSEDALKAYIMERLCGREDVKIGKIRWMGPYTINVRMVDNLKSGRVFITGDAAHIHSPTGAQGMNTGIQDSYNIGWKLALVQKCLAPPSILDTVTEERIPVVAEMLNITSGVLRKLVEANTEHGRRPEVVMMYGVNYRSSSLVKDDGPDAEEAKNVSAYGGGSGSVFAGDRAPDATGLIKMDTREPVRLFTLFGPTHHTVVVFADKDKDVYHPSSTILGKYPADLVRFVVIRAAGCSDAFGSVDTYEDAQGHAYNAYKDSQSISGVFIVRPDGFVGARLSHLDKVDIYFKGIFSDKF